MVAIRSHVQLEDGFPRLARDTGFEIAEAIMAASALGAQAARDVASPRRRTGEMGNIEVLPIGYDRKGLVGGFRSPAPWAWFQDEGTLGNRTKPLKQPGRRRRAAPPDSGIEPLKFMEAGRTIGRRQLLIELKRRLP